MLIDIFAETKKIKDTVPPPHWAGGLLFSPCQR